MSGLLYYQYFYQGPLSLAVASTASKIRTPAATLSSMSALSKARDEKKIISLDWKFNLNCKNTEQAVRHVKNSVILNLKKCERNFPNLITIENETNGFTASVFSMTADQSKTDSIPLKKGKNTIVIKYQLSKSKLDVVEKLSIEH